MATVHRLDNTDSFENGTLLSAACQAQIADAIRTILETVGDRVDAEGTRETPARVARMYDELLEGYSTDIDTLLNNALFDVEYDEMVVVRDIDFYSLCEHHLVPFHGRAHVGYLPDKKVIGLSKIPRIVEMYARRLQVQERMTQEIAQTLEEAVHARGVGVVIEAQHLCAAMRGVRKTNAVMTTSAVRGRFKSSNATRQEFMNHVRGGATAPLQS